MTKPTWTCHICGRVRADKDVGVFKRDISENYMLKPGTVTINTRYCLDSTECEKGARKRKDFMQQKASEQDDQN